MNIIFVPHIGTYKEAQYQKLFGISGLVCKLQTKFPIVGNETSRHATLRKEIFAIFFLTFRRNQFSRIGLYWGFRRRIYGGCTPPPITIFFDFRLRSLRYEKDFLPVWSKLSQASMVKIFQMSGRWFPWHPKGGVYTPP